MRPFRPQTKQYWRIVLLCFVAAATFWLLNALNKSYSTQTTYPIRFVYNSRNMVPVTPLPEEISINVTGKGWKLLRKSLRFEVQPAEIHIRSLPRNNYLLGAALRPSLVNVLDGLQLNFVVTDTLFFNFDERIRRTVPLQVERRQPITEARFAVVGPIRTEPDSITFAGPSSMVDSIASPFLISLPDLRLSAPARLELPVAYDNKSLVKASVNTVSVIINVRGLLQEERQIQPELVNVPEGATLNLSPSYLLVRYQLLEDSVVLLNRDSFKAVIDYAKFNRQDSTIAPELIQQPAGVRNVTLWPNRLKAVLERER